MLWLVLRELQGRDLTSNLLSTQFRGTQGKGQQIQSCRLKPSNQQSANTFKDKATRINVKVDCWNAAILSKAAWSTCGLFVGILCTTLFFPVIEVHGGFTEDRGTSKQKRSTAKSSKENLVSFTRLQKSFKCVAGKTSGNTLKVLGGSEALMVCQNRFAQGCTRCFKSSRTLHQSNESTLQFSHIASGSEYVGISWHHRSS